MKRCSKTIKTIFFRNKNAFIFNFLKNRFLGVKGTPNEFMFYRSVTGLHVAKIVRTDRKDFFADLTNVITTVKSEVVNVAKMIFVQVEEESAFKLLSTPADQPRMAYIVFQP